MHQKRAQVLKNCFNFCFKCHSLSTQIAMAAIKTLKQTREKRKAKNSKSIGKKNETGTERKGSCRVLLSLIQVSFRLLHYIFGKKISQWTHFLLCFSALRVWSLPLQKDLKMTTCHALERSLKMSFWPCMLTIYFLWMVPLTIPFSTMTVCNSWVFDSLTKHLFWGSVDFLKSSWIFF